jgi:DNA-binding NarL/FixJ family response regulator
MGDQPTKRLFDIIDRPDIALVDLSLPGKISLELLRDLRAVAPTMGILVVSLHETNVYMRNVLYAPEHAAM